MAKSKSQNEHLFSLAIVAIVAIVALFVLVSPSQTSLAGNELSSVGQATMFNEKTSSDVTEPDIPDEVYNLAYTIAFDLAYGRGFDYYYDTYGTTQYRGASDSNSGSVVFTIDNSVVTITPTTDTTYPLTISVNPDGLPTLNLRLKVNPDGTIEIQHHQPWIPWNQWKTRCRSDSSGRISCDRIVCLLSQEIRELLGDDCSGTTSIYEIKHAMQRGDLA